MKVLAQLRAQIIGLPRNTKKAVLIGFDFGALALVLWMSFSLRLDRWTPPANLAGYLVLLSAPVVSIPIFVRFGLYRAVVRYLPERALWTMIQAVTLSVLAWVLVAFFFQLTKATLVPRSVPFIYWALAIVVICGSRFAAKWVFWPGTNSQRSTRPKVVIYGAGMAGAQLAVSLRGSYFIAGFLDDDPKLSRREVAGLRVFLPSHLPVLMRTYGVQKVIISIPSLSADRKREIVAWLSDQGISALTIPSATDLVTGKYHVDQVRNIEIDELLGRSSVPPDIDLVKEVVVGKTIMVTGAGGSIGSELCRKIAQWRPQRLVLFEANEFALYTINRQLEAAEDLVIVPVLGSVTDQPRVSASIREYGVDVLFHAAAHKHVPLVEANALEGIKNNVFGTRIVAETAFSEGVETFVLISTDKAVRPTNVMGATKRWAELIVRDVAEKALHSGKGQRFCAVRFGNVLGSNGSVVPLFKEQISHGGPVTLTDVRMTRYFMSIEEAAELIVQAGALSQGGDVFLLDMGEPVLISDLAENMVRLAGLSVKTVENPEGEIEIVAVGKRPGEKLYEELFYDATGASRTRHAKILRASSASFTPLQDLLGRMKIAVDGEDEASARHLLFEVVTQSDESLAGSLGSVSNQDRP